MSSAKPIDYSKWDNIDCSSSDDDDDDEVDDNNNKNKYIQPRVTKIDTPGKVTRSSDGTISIENSNTNNITTTTPTKATSIVKNKEDSKPKSSSSISSLTKNGSSFIDTKTKYVILWSQDRYEINITIPYSTSNILTKSVNVICNGTLPYKNRYCATTNLLSNNNNDNEQTEEGDSSNSCSHGSLIIKATLNNGSDACMLNGSLPHFIHTSQEYDEEDNDNDKNNVDWYIETNSYNKYSDEIQSYLPNIISPSNNDNNTNTINFLHVTLYKAVPMEGMFIWWDQLLAHCLPKIDLSVQDRKDDEKKTFKDAWEEAHDLFRQKHKT